MEPVALILRAVEPLTLVPVLARVGGLVTFFPLLGVEAIPARFRIVIAVAISWVLRPYLPVVALDPAAGLPAGTLFLGRELLLGAALGFSAQVALAAFEAAGTLVGFQLGMTLSGVIDPINGDQLSVLPIFYRLLATAIYFTIDAHHVFIRVIRDSYAWVGPGAIVPGAAFAETMMSVSAGLFGLAIRIAAPALVIAVVLDFCLLLAGRALPQVHLLLLGFPLKIGLGLYAVAASLALMPTLARETLRVAVEQSRQIAAGLAVLN